MITFNGKAANEFDDIRSIMTVVRPVSPGARVRMQQIAGRAGILYFGKDREPKVISFRIVLRSSSNAELRKSVRDIAAWLDTEDPAPLIFSDEPELKYNAVLVEPIMTEEFAAIGFADVQFLVPSGYAEKIQVKTTGPIDENEGTEKCPCIIDADMNENSSSLKITLDQTGEFVQIDYDLVTNDSIMIDTEKHLTTINGLDARAHVTYASDYFRLPVGNFNLSADANISMTVEFRELFK